MMVAGWLTKRSKTLNSLPAHLYPMLGVAPGRKRYEFSNLLGSVLEGAALTMRVTACTKVINHSHCAAKTNDTHMRQMLEYTCAFACFWLSAMDRTQERCQMCISDSLGFEPLAALLFLPISSYFWSRFVFALTERARSLGKVTHWF